MPLDAIGLGLGATQFAAEIAVTIVKLKRLWDEVQDVPDHIQFILSELEEVEFVLEDLEAQIKCDEVPAELQAQVLPRVLRSTQRASEALQKNLQTLNDQLTQSKGLRRKFVSMRVVIKKPMLEKMEGQLRTALNLLNLAVNTYTMQVPRAVCRIIMTRLPLPAPVQIESAVDVQIVPANNVPSQQVGNMKDGKRKDHERIRTVYPGTSWVGRISFTLGSNNRYELAVQAPTWLTGSVYTVMAERSILGWNTELRVHNVIPSWRDITAIDLVLETDDTSLLLKLLTFERLPLLTRDQDGNTLLDLASWSGSVQTFGKLVELGLTGYILDNRWSGILSAKMDYWIYKLYAAALSKTGYMAQQRSAHDMIDILNLLLPFDTENRIGNLQTFTGLIIPGHLVNVKRYRDNFLPNLSLSDRLRCARLILSRPPIRRKELRALLPECWPTQSGEYEFSCPDVVEFSRTDGCSIVHSVAVGLGLVPSKVDDFDSKALETLGCAMLRQCFALDTAALHCLEQDFLTCAQPGWESKGGLQTPFSAYLRSAIRTHVLLKTPLHKLGAAFDDILSTWFWTIRARVGDDFRAYGREERRLNKGADMPTGLMNLNLWLQKRQIRLIGITFGSRRADWVLWWANEYEEFAGDFWASVEEHLHLAIPGSWPDDAYDNSGKNDCEDEVWICGSGPAPLIWSEVSSRRT